MTSKLFVEETEEEPGLPLTPLIDIVFLLLIFYLSISRIQTAEEQLGIRLPTAGTSSAATQHVGDVVINIASDGDIIVNNQVIDLAGLIVRLGRLAQIFPGQAVIIRSDAGTEWEQVCQVLDACTAADIWNIKFAVVPHQ